MKEKELSAQTESVKLEIKQDLIFAFWFAVHLEELSIANLIATREDSIRQIIKASLHVPQEPDSDPEEKWDVKDEKEESFDSHNFSGDEEDDQGPNGRQG